MWQMTIRRTRLLWLPFVLLSIGATACGSDDATTAADSNTAATDTATGENETGGDETSGASEGYLVDTWLLGVNASLTGGAEGVDGPNVRGMELAVEEINASGGVNGREIALTILDNGTDGTRAGDNARRLVEEDVVAIVGGGTSGIALPISEVAEDESVPYMATQANTMEFAEGKRPFTFRINAPGIEFNTIGVDHLRDFEGVTQIAVVATTNTFGQEGKQQILDNQEQLGVEVVDTFDIEPGTLDATTIVSQLAQSGANGVIYLENDGPAGVAMTEAKRTLEYETLTYLNSGAVGIILDGSGPDAFPEELNYRAGPFWWSPDTNERARAFANLYEEAHGELPATGELQNTAYGYDAIHLVADALGRVELDDASGIVDLRQMVRDELENITDFPLALGKDDAVASYSPDRHDALVASEHAEYVAVVNGETIPIRE